MENMFSKLDSVNADWKVLLLTHIDMDAAGAEIVCNTVFKNLTVKRLTNNAMSDNILEEVQNNEETKEYDIILIADISCTDEVAQQVNTIKKETGMKIVLLDHHATAANLNKYDWAVVRVNMYQESAIGYKYEASEIEKAHSSGTSLMYDYLVYNGVIEQTPFLDELVHIIAAYDTWDWHTLFNDNERYSYMDKLCDAYGIDIFVNEMTQRALNEYTAQNIFNDRDLFMLDVQQKKIDEHLKHIENSFTESMLTLGNGEYYSVVWCLASEFLQETFELMKNKFPNKDIYIINFGSGISLRSVKDGIDLGQFVKLHYDGGGHYGAAGFGIKSDMIHEYMEKILKGTLLPVD